MNSPTRNSPTRNSPRRQSIHISIGIPSGAPATDPFLVVDNSNRGKLYPW